MKIKHIALAVALAMGSGAVLADTSSAIRGKITTPEGTAAAGTKIIITHVPSGTTREVVTNESGSFVASGLRVGGPYKVVVDSDTYSDETLDGIFLQLGDTFQINQALQSDSVERIAVTGSAIAYSSSGSASYFGADDIANAPSLNRDIKDLVRNNPLVVVAPGPNAELSVAGTNPRFNSINVDGIAQNDDFGLNSNGYPTQRPPISMDAIEQLSIETSPFNAKASGFQGALIDAVTKSGTNETKGSVFYEFMNDGMAGTPTNELTGKEVKLDYDTKTMGATLGGAVVQDKLFFFTAIEKFENESQPIWGPAGSSAGSVSNVTAANLAEVTRIAKEVYGIDAGSWDLAPAEDDEKLLIKLDWNMNDQHRSAFTYQYNKGNKTENTSSAATTLRLSSNWYNKEETLNNYAYKLYSDWTSDFSTQISATYMDVATVQESFEKGIGDVVIRTAAPNAPFADIAIGSDSSRHSNDLAKKVFILGLDGDYLMDEHHFSFGYQLKRSDIFNLFLQSTKGSYQFDTIADFEARRAHVYYKNALSLDPNDAAANFVRSEHAVYAQDEYALADDFTLTYGLRYERLTSDDVPLLNEQFVTRHGFANTENLDGIDILLPRVGFKWDATVDLTVRGGVGRFSGGQPTVWVSNSYSNPGVGVGETASNSTSSPIFENVDLSSVPQALRDQVASGSVASDVNFVDPNYELPSDWRAQLAADYVFSIPGLGDDFSWTTEYLYMKRQNESYWIDLTLEDYKVGTTADGQRELYNVPSNLRRDLMLTNTDLEGTSRIFNTSLFKDWNNGLTTNLSYTNQDIEDVHVSTSSTASSNFGNNVVINRNDAILGRSTFETEHRFVFNIGYEYEFFAGYPTNVNVFFERRSGRPVSYVINGSDIDGSGGPLRSPFDSGRDTSVSPRTTNAAFLPYIPSSESDPAVRFLNDAAKADFFARIKELGLDQYAGQYLPKGAGTSPWVSSMDLSIRQSIPGFVEGHTGTFYVTVNNMLNLINDDWGQVYATRFGTITLANFAIDPTTKQTVYAGVRASDKAYEEFFAQESAYRIKVGVNYRF
jgi:hypothetical protein